MNSLLQTFEDYFSPFYYYNSSGRAYVEYSCSSVSGYNGKIGFSHFSLSENNKNIFFNYKIYKFIEQYYPWAFESILVLLEHCIAQGVILSIISITENEFLLRTSEGNVDTRDLISDIYRLNTKKEFKYPHESFKCPLELRIIKNANITLNIYQKIDLPESISYQQSYLEENNIFLTILSREYTEEYALQDSYLFKLYEPLSMISSSFLSETYYIPYVKKYFESESIYVNCIEQKNKEDVIYFTKSYKVEA